MVIKKIYLVKILFLILLFTLFCPSLINATHLVTIASGENSFNVNEDVSNFYNITVNNTDVGQDASISWVNISIDGNFFFVMATNGSNAVGNFSNTSNMLVWRNSSVILINGSEKKFFWFNATAPTPGSFNITIMTYNSTNVVLTNISVTVNDTTYPSVIINTPANNQNLSSKTIPINLSVIDASLSYTNITIYNLTGSIVNSTTNSSATTYVLSLTVPIDGTYNITATSYDSAGNSNLTSKVVNIDSAYPVLTLVSPSNNQYLSSQVFTLNFTATDTNYYRTNVTIYNSTLSIINTTIYSTQGNNALSYTLPRDDTYSVNLTAIDYTGNSNTSSVFVISDTVYPSVIINSPTNNQNLSSKTIAINLSVNDSGLSYTNITIYNLTGSIVNSTTNSSTGIFVLSLTVPIDGTYNITATSYDSAGNSNLTSKVAIIDSTNPSLTIVSPSNNQYLSSQTFVLNFTTTDTNYYRTNITIYNSTLSITNTTINSVQGNNGVSFTLPRDDTYSINLTSTDYNGNTNTSSVFVSSDTVYPSVIINLPTNYQNLSSRTLSVNLTVTESNLNSTIISAYYTNGTIAASVSNTSTGLYVTSLTVPVDGTYNLTATSNDYSSHSNVTSRVITVDSTAPVLSIISPLNNSIFYSNQTIFVNFTAVDAGLGNSILWWFNGSINQTFSSLTTVSYPTNGSHTFIFYANDSLNNVKTQIINFNVSNLPGNTTVAASNQTIYIADNLTNIVVPYNSSLQTVNINSSVLSTRSITIDLSQLNNNGLVVTGSNSFALVRQGTTSYTALIPASTTITGGSSWDGKVILPTINSSVFTSPSESGQSTSVDVVINLGSQNELNFSNAIKITISGKAGKHAAWTRGNTTLTQISTVCNSATNPTNIDTTTTRECYIDSGSDLIIWTYHFTEFAAYTSTTVSSTDDSSGGSSGSGVTPSSTYLIIQSQLTKGYTKLIKTGDKIKFPVNKATHIFNLDSVSANSAAFTVTSSPQKFTANVGEVKKIELTGDNYYDISVKLNKVNVALKSAEFTLKSIKEAIPEPVPVVQEIKTDTAPPVVVTKNEPVIPTPVKTKESLNTNSVGPTFIIVLIILVLVVIGIIIFVSKKKNRKVKTKAKKHRR